MLSAFWNADQSAAMAKESQIASAITRRTAHHVFGWESASKRARITFVNEPKISVGNFKYFGKYCEGNRYIVIDHVLLKIP